MENKKFTDEEVIKALECCVKSSHFGECFDNKCPLVSEHGCKVGKETLYPYAIDLINRQKAEIESLKDLIIRNDEKHLSYTARLFKEERERIQIERTRRLEAEIDRLNFGNLQMVASIKRLKSEAIKEFAERLKKAKQYSLERHENIVPVAVIDWIVKEMTEG